MFRGEKKPGLYTPGVDLRAKVTLLAEGARGSVTQVCPKWMDSGPVLCAHVRPKWMDSGSVLCVHVRPKWMDSGSVSCVHVWPAECVNVHVCVCMCVCVYWVWF